MCNRNDLIPYILVNGFMNRFTVMKRSFTVRHVKCVVLLACCSIVPERYASIEVK